MENSLCNHSVLTLSKETATLSFSKSTDSHPRALTLLIIEQSLLSQRTPWVIITGHSLLLPLNIHSSITTENSACHHKRLTLLPQRTHYVVTESSHSNHGEFTLVVKKITHSVITEHSLFCHGALISSLWQSTYPVSESTHFDIITEPLSSSQSTHSDVLEHSPLTLLSWNTHSVAISKNLRHYPSPWTKKPRAVKCSTVLLTNWIKLTKFYVCHSHASLCP